MNDFFITISLKQVWVVYQDAHCHHSIASEEQIIRTDVLLHCSWRDERLKSKKNKIICPHFRLGPQAAVFGNLKSLPVRPPAAHMRVKLIYNTDQPKAFPNFSFISL
jgi:hypothetical protein